jgi:hypothetical protein
MSAVDINNSSTSLLSSWEVLTGVWYNVLHYTAATISIVVQLLIEMLIETKGKVRV